MQISIPQKGGNINMDNCVEIHNCRLCNSDKIGIVLDFGHVNLANSFFPVTEFQKAQYSFPLQAYLCENCSAVGLKHSVNPDILFKTYFYESSTSASFRKHFEDYAKSVSEFCGLQKGDVVVDVGCNDLITLKPFKALGFNTVGIEPATNIVEKYKTPEIPVVNSFLNPETATVIKDGYGNAKLVTCNNCFAHLFDYHSFIESIKMMLDDDGHFVFENAYLLDTVKNCDAGQFYHEHSQYHSIKALQKFFRRHEMNIVHVERNNIQCGSIRVFVKKSRGEFVDFYSVNSLIKQEEEAGLHLPQTYKDMGAKVIDNGVKLREILKQAKAENKVISLYAWPAKMTTLFCLWKLDNFFDIVVDDAVAKQGMISPVGDLTILHKSKFLDSDYAVIGAYNFNEIIIKNNPEFKGKWITILPDIQIL